jgi:hypothetical protein
MQIFGCGPKFSIFRLPISIFHLGKMENGKWKLANSFPAAPKGPLVRGEVPERA